jgi:hypothetical protein
MILSLYNLINPCCHAMEQTKKLSLSRTTLTNSTLVKMFIRKGIQELFDVGNIEHTWKTKDHHGELQNCWCHGKWLIFCCGWNEAYFNAYHCYCSYQWQTLLWLALLMCLSLVTNVSFHKIFTNGTGVSLVSLPPHWPMLPNFQWQLWLLMARMVTFATKITSFVTTANTGVWWSW